MRKLVHRMDRELKQVERLAIKESRKILEQIRRRVVGTFRRKEEDLRIDDLLQKLVPILRDLAVATHLTGRKRSKLLQPKGLQLGAFDKILKVLVKQQDADIAALQQIYQTDALRIVNDISQQAENLLRHEVGRLISAGAHVKDGTKALGKKLVAVGVSARHAETIFRTQSQMAYNAGRFQADQDEAIQEILWGYEYVATTDDRVRPEHEALDGTRLPKDNPFWETFWPPNGWNCRCQVIPLYDKQRSKKAPKGVEPDEGFAINPGRIFN